MSSNLRSGGPNNSTTTTTTTTSTFSSNRPSQARSGPSTIERRDFSPEPVVGNADAGPSTDDTVEPFPTISREPLSRPLTREHTRPQDRGPLSGTSYLTPTSTQNPRRRPIGIKRISSNDVRPGDNSVSSAGRLRASSAPQRPDSAGTDTSLSKRDSNHLHPTLTGPSNLAPVVEGQVSNLNEEDNTRNTTQTDTRPTRSGSNRMRAVSDAARSAVSRMSGRSEDAAPQPRRDEEEYDHDVVDLLDVLDPEVSALTTLTNVQNSLFVPDLGRWINRRPTYELTRGPSRIAQKEAALLAPKKPLPPTPSKGPVPPPKDRAGLDIMSDIEEETEVLRRPRRGSIASVVQEEHWAVLPHGVSLEGWTQEEKELLDDHVRHMLHSKRSKFALSMKAFGKYIRKPLGFAVTLYAFLITLFGLTWVLCLIGWIYTGARQPYIINVVDNVLVALFAVVGDGMAPFRAVDTYHMIFIARYYHLSWRVRKQRALPKLQDHNDLPEKVATAADLEAAAKAEAAEFSVLTRAQQRKLQHHSDKFAKSHSFYKPHETATHHAFPLRLLIAIVVLLDCHSLFQIALGTCTWSIDYHNRPVALTTTILCCSITVNIVAGILIKIGDKRTRKQDVLERLERQQLTTQAMKKVTKRKETIIEGDKRLDEELEEEWVKKHKDSSGDESMTSREGDGNTTSHYTIEGPRAG